MKKWMTSAAFGLLTLAAFAQTGNQWKTGTSGTYTYRYVTNDPMGARYYTLKNGLTVVLSPNHREPRISVRIAVRAGSNMDPKDHTGLAHYLEHLLFKGTDQYGSLDWSKEKPLLDEIQALYEKYNATTDRDQRKAIYHTIDSVSGVASHYSIANEYDHMMAALGSQGTNAHTFVEETVYEEDIPSNAVDPFLKIQAERFRYPVFRLFHTELEAVYEEKNRGLDNDGSKMQEAMLSGVFPTHNYGQQTTIGTVAHLKSPSLVAIRNFYNTYYVPGNMAFIMAGDFDPDQLIAKIDQAFSILPAKPVRTYAGPKEHEIDSVVTREVWGPTPEIIRIAFRTAPAGTRDAMMANLVSALLSNGKAGLLDVHLNREQKVQHAGSDIWQFKDYGVLYAEGAPKQGQSLDEVRRLLMEELNKLRTGDFDESLIKATAANNKLSVLQGLSKNDARVEEIMDQFIKNKGTEWDKDVAYTEEMGKITKAELVAFARRVIRDNGCVVIYKRKGEDKSIVKVEKPPISPVETNAGKSSPFVNAIISTPLPAIQPVWVDYNQAIQKNKTGIADLLYVPNKENGLFELSYHFKMGNWTNRYLQPAVQYLQYLGTDQHSADDIAARFYGLACNYSISVGTEETVVNLSGLQENFDAAVALLQDLLTRCKPDDAALAGLKDAIAKGRADAKLNKRALTRAIVNYAFYGPHNPINFVLTDAELSALKASDLTDQLHNLFNFKHVVSYYGPLALAAVAADLDKSHPLPATWSSAAQAVTFRRQDQPANTVLFTSYDAVQAEVYWARTLDAYANNKVAVVNLFNNYFGGGMGSIVFRTIRESKALAYSTSAYVVTPPKSDDRFYLSAYVGCQADKFKEAASAMDTLLNESLPLSEEGFNNAKRSAMKDMETERITGADILNAYFDISRKGLDNDPRQGIYTQLKGLTLDDLSRYHQQEVEHKPFAYCVIGSPKRISAEELQQLGPVTVLTPEQLLGF